MQSVASHSRRMESADAMTFGSQLDPQTSSWFDRSSFEVQQCQTPSTDVQQPRQFSSNVTMALSFPSSTLSNCLHQRQTLQGRFRSKSAMSNSIDSRSHPFPSAPPLPPYYNDVSISTYNNVELHRRIVATLPLPSPAMSNSIDCPILSSPVFSLEIAVELSNTAN